MADHLFTTSLGIFILGVCTWETTSFHHPPSRQTKATQREGRRHDPPRCCQVVQMLDQTGQFPPAVSQALTDAGAPARFGLFERCEKKLKDPQFVEFPRVSMLGVFFGFYWDSVFFCLVSSSWDSMLDSFCWGSICWGSYCSATERLTTLRATFRGIGATFLWQSLSSEFPEKSQWVDSV